MPGEITVVEKFTKLLKQYGVDTVFGIVGIPIVTLANEFINQGIKFISCRNEQAASYAASAYGYLTNRPGVLLVVGGPGLIHALPGMYNSTYNKWPLVVIAGSNDNGNEQYKGAFQELDQISLLGNYVKFKGKLTGENMENVVFNAFNHAIQGTFGVTYIDFPGILIESNSLLEGKSNWDDEVTIDKIKSSPDQTTVSKISRLIVDAKSQDKKVLVVIGKGSVYYSSEVRTFIDKFNLPFLPTPMAKGVVPDNHMCNVSSARSFALANADIILVFGARLNWILHYAESPKWKTSAIFIQCDNDPETLGHNNMNHVNLSLLGDLDLTITSITEELVKKYPDYKHNTPSKELISKIESNRSKLQELEKPKDETAELNYNTVYGKISPLIDDESTMLIFEGANTMDKARISFSTSFPLRRLDAGTNGTMGVGLGYLMASRLANPNLDNILIQGDSAFGFSGMEIETLCRFKLGSVIIIMNNSGIYHGNDVNSATKLGEKTRYDLLAQGLGAKGYYVTTLEELESSFKQAVRDSRENNIVSVLNVIIEHGKAKQVGFAWQNKPKK
ncbi:hypothetical protein KAFR_0H02890 [Kazachstania africana CBS 2517]|uniref:2-hydroxyacyl-CoA lyase n=1 Tax=Kazachstania africana (strain ATCC 22294 / BCRC 22015 / CBS 2517 / CECT 1963 / NBRC 1671 / NRRL Y-8276) TaxID=1071382 RepID=H2AZE2_KAZAF|nr:hypothetical protein KAFR_0H02890 [Kazachstania africana CBS 2517]CCF59698.1 hypothetical protein KAFR_0H02890 [Kazachstania africana CBS 2517]